MYCDRLTGGPGATGTCAGRTVVVEPHGRIRLDLEARTAVAIY